MTLVKLRREITCNADCRCTGVLQCSRLSVSLRADVAGLGQQRSKPRRPSAQGHPQADCIQRWDAVPSTANELWPCSSLTGDARNRHRGMHTDPLGSKQTSQSPACCKTLPSVHVRDTEFEPHSVTIQVQRRPQEQQVRDSMSCMWGAVAGSLCESMQCQGVRIAGVYERVCAQRCSEGPSVTAIRGQRAAVHQLPAACWRQRQAAASNPAVQEPNSWQLPNRPGQELQAAVYTRPQLVILASKAGGRPRHDGSPDLSGNRQVTPRPGAFLRSVPIT
jgi:hypothetical protein